MQTIVAPTITFYDPRPSQASPTQVDAASPLPRLLLQRTAQALRLDPAPVLTEHDAGLGLGQIFPARGIDEEQLLAAVGQALDSMVQEGRMNRDTAHAMLDRIRDCGAEQSRDVVPHRPPAQQLDESQPMVEQLQRPYFRVRNGQGLRARLGDRAALQEA